MDFEWSVDERNLIARIREFSARLGRADIPGDDQRARWRACGDFGLLGLSAPVELGGLGLGALSTAAAIEAWAASMPDTGLVFSACAHLFACVMPLVEHATPAQQARWFPGLTNGALIGANAITEPEAGSDVFNMREICVQVPRWNTVNIG